MRAASQASGRLPTPTERLRPLQSSVPCDWEVSGSLPCGHLSMAIPHADGPWRSQTSMTWWRTAILQASPMTAMTLRSPRSNPVAPAPARSSAPVPVRWRMRSSHGSAYRRAMGLQSRVATCRSPCAPARGGFQQRIWPRTSACWRSWHGCLRSARTTSAMLCSARDGRWQHHGTGCM